MSSCPLCGASLIRTVRYEESFLTCSPCQLAWLTESDLEAQGGRLHFHRARSSQRCPSCSGEQFERTAIMPHGMVAAFHCPDCRALTFKLATLLESFPRSRPASPVRPRQPRKPPPREIDERDRVFAFFLALPLELSEERDTAPIGVAVLVLACVVTFVLDVLSDGAFGSALAFSTTNGSVHMAIGTLTSAFVHLDALHLLGNMYFLYAFGRFLERQLSTDLVIALFASSAVVASLAFWAVHFGQETALAGASGAVAGILGCYFSLFPSRMVGISLFFVVIKIPAAIFLGVWLVLQLVSMPQELGVAYSAHAGGFLAGLVWGLAIRRTTDFDAK